MATAQSKQSSGSGCLILIVILGFIIFSIASCGTSDNDESPGEGFGGASNGISDTECRHLGGVEVSEAILNYDTETKTTNGSFEVTYCMNLESPHNMIGRMK